MIRMVERTSERMEFDQGMSSTALTGLLLIASAGTLAFQGIVGLQVPILMLLFGLMILMVFGDATHVVLDKSRNVVHVRRRRFLRGTDEDVLPLDSVQGVFVGRKAWALFSSALYLQALDDLRVSGFQFSRMGYLFFSSHLAAFLDVPCVNPGKLDPIGRIAQGEKHPMDRLVSGSTDKERDPWEQAEHPLDRLVPKRVPKRQDAQGEPDADVQESGKPEQGPDRGPDGTPLQ